jgi:hypothetical protein
VGHLRHALPGGLTETIGKHAQRGAYTRQQTHCPAGARLWTARAPVARTVEPMGGAVQRRRPDFSGRACRCGVSPLDEVLGLVPGRLQRDGHQAAATLVTAVPYAAAQTVFGPLTGVDVSRERMQTVTKHVAEGLTVLAGTPSRDEIERRISAVAAGHRRRPVVVLGSEGAFVSPRPASARQHRPGRPGQRAKRVLWRGQWRDAQGWRFSRLAGERIVPLLRGHQVHQAAHLGEARKHVKEAAVRPEEPGRRCGVCAGAEWRWQHVQTLCPQACQGLDSSHCAQALHRVAKAPMAPQARPVRGSKRPCLGSPWAKCVWC